MTILPPFCFAMMPQTSFAHLNVALRWTAMTWSQSLSCIDWNDLSRRMPAFAISTSIRLFGLNGADNAVAMIVDESSAEATQGMAWPPAGDARGKSSQSRAGDARCGRSMDVPFVISSQTAFAPFSLTSLTTTPAPNAANMSAYARPSPAPAPVMTTTCLSNLTSELDCLFGDSDDASFSTACSRIVKSETMVSLGG